MVTKEAYETCNSTNPISLKSTGPATSPWTQLASTMDQHCPLGQKLAINVSDPRPRPSPVLPVPRGPITGADGRGTTLTFS
ncbi:hypothetical protein CRYUN_Cryun03dG0071100 [Craigia yunnanensis]